MRGLPGYHDCQDSSGGTGILQRARWERHERGTAMTTAAVQEPPLTRSDLRDELDRALKHYATKDDVANLKVWIVGLLLVVVLNVVGTAGVIVAAFLAG